MAHSQSIGQLTFVSETFSRIFRLKPVISPRLTTKQVFHWLKGLSLVITVFECQPKRHGLTSFQDRSNFREICSDYVPSKLNYMYEKSRLRWPHTVAAGWLKGQACQADALWSLLHIDNNARERSLLLFFYFFSSLSFDEFLIFIIFVSAFVR